MCEDTLVYICIRWLTDASWINFSHWMSRVGCPLFKSRVKAWQLASHFLLFPFFPPAFCPLPFECWPAPVHVIQVIVNLSGAFAKNTWLRFSYHSTFYVIHLWWIFQALDLFERSGHQQSFLPTSLDDLDKQLHGGLTCGTITEVTASFFPSYCFFVTEIFYLSQ